jgi:hypothetical protein
MDLTATLSAMDAAFGAGQAALDEFDIAVGAQPSCTHGGAAPPASCAAAPPSPTDGGAPAASCANAAKLGSAFKHAHWYKHHPGPLVIDPRRAEQYVDVYDGHSLSDVAIGPWECSSGRKLVPRLVSLSGGDADDGLAGPTTAQFRNVADPLTSMLLVPSDCLYRTVLMARSYTCRCADGGNVQFLHNWAAKIVYVGCVVCCSHFLKTPFGEHAVHTAFRSALSGGTRTSTARFLLYGGLGHGPSTMAFSQAWVALKRAITVVHERDLAANVKFWNDKCDHATAEELADMAVTGDSNWSRETKGTSCTSTALGVTRGHDGTPQAVVLAQCTVERTTPSRPTVGEDVAAAALDPFAVAAMLKVLIANNVRVPAFVCDGDGNTATAVRKAYTEAGLPVPVLLRCMNHWFNGIRKLLAGFMPATNSAVAQADVVDHPHRHTYRGGVVLAAKAAAVALATTLSDALGMAVDVADAAPEAPAGGASGKQAYQPVISLAQITKAYAAVTPSPSAGAASEAKGGGGGGAASADAAGDEADHGDGAMEDAASGGEDAGAGADGDEADDRDGAMEDAAGGGGGGKRGGTGSGRFRKVQAFKTIKQTPLQEARFLPERLKQLVTQVVNQGFKSRAEFEAGLLKGLVHLFNDDPVAHQWCGAGCPVLHPEARPAGTATHGASVLRVITHPGLRKFLYLIVWSMTQDWEALSHGRWLTNYNESINNAFMRYALNKNTVYFRYYEARLWLATGMWSRGGAFIADVAAQSGLPMTLGDIWALLLDGDVHVNAMAKRRTSESRHKEAGYKLRSKYHASSRTAPGIKKYTKQSAFLQQFAEEHDLSFDFSQIPQDRRGAVLTAALAWGKAQEVKAKEAAAAVKAGKKRKRAAGTGSAAAEDGTSLAPGDVAGGNDGGTARSGAAAALPSPAAAGAGAGARAAAASRDAAAGPAKGKAKAAAGASQAADLAMQLGLPLGAVLMGAHLPPMPGAAGWSPALAPAAPRVVAGDPMDPGIWPLWSRVRVLSVRYTGDGGKPVSVRRNQQIMAAFEHENSDHHASHHELLLAAWGAQKPSQAARAGPDWMDDRDGPG